MADSNVTDTTTESSADWSNTTDTETQNPEDPEDQRVVIANIITYAGSAIAIVGVMLTLLSYIGYRKFHVKRPHIITVNLCACLLVYYFSYMLSNGHRQGYFHSTKAALNENLCLFGVTNMLPAGHMWFAREIRVAREAIGALMCHFSLLVAWMWILSYWLLLLMMYRRPMGGHVSHFFIKAAIPAYTIPLIIAVGCGVGAYNNGDLDMSMHHHNESLRGGFFNDQCFVANLYLYLGGVLPFFLAFIPMLTVFIIVLRGIIGKKDDGATSNSYKKVKHHFKRLTFITILLVIVAVSSMFAPAEVRIIDTQLLAAEIVFSVASSILGLALMILFCIHQEEIRSHWLSVARGENASMRKHSVVTRGSIEGGNASSARKSSGLMGNHPSVYIQSYDEERKSSTYRIVAKEDTDMSTLGLIQIPGTPSPNRLHDTNDESADAGNAKVRRKRSDASSRTKRLTPKSIGDDEKEPLTPKSDDAHFEALKDKSDTWTKSKKQRKTRSTSTPPPTPRKDKSAKRQKSVEDMAKHSNTTGRNGTQHHHSEKKHAKRSNSGNKMTTRFTKKSTSTPEDTVQLTDFD